MTQVLIDTGPLVALFSRRDNHHQACVEQLRSLPAPLITCWPVITEASWLLRSDPNAVEKLLQCQEEGLIRIDPLDTGTALWLAKFLSRYQSLNAQVADGCLVYLAERDDIDTVFTLDRRDFSVYRFRQNKSFHILPE